MKMQKRAGRTWAEEIWRGLLAGGSHPTTGRGTCAADMWADRTRLTAACPAALLDKDGALPPRCQRAGCVRHGDRQGARQGEAAARGGAGRRVRLRRRGSGGIGRHRRRSRAVASSNQAFGRPFLAPAKAGLSRSPARPPQ